MRILIVCATPAEAVLTGFSGIPAVGFTQRLLHTEHGAEVFISGVGIMSTAYYLGRHLLQHRYDLAINIGICGAFDRSIIPGTVVNITRDCFADSGAQDDETFLDLFQLGLADADEAPYEKGWLHTNYDMSNAVVQSLPEVKGLTLNTTSGNEANIYKLRERFGADVETMEGAAFIYCCRMNNIPCLQIRSVSNYIEKRNRDAWQIGQAMKSLEKVFEEIIKGF